MTEVHAGNIYRKARALVAKTVAAGCEIQDAVSAANLASKLINDNKLNTEKVEWPAAPEGYAWRGKPGRDGRIEAVVGHAKTAPVEEAPKPAEAPKPTEGEKAVKRRQAAAKPAKAAAKPAKAAPREPTKPGEFRAGTKAAKVLSMLRSKQGTTIAAIMAEFGILEHSARALVSTTGKRVGKKAAYDRETKVYKIEA